MNITSADKRSVRKLLTDKGEQLQHHRTEATLETYSTILNSNQQETQENAMQRQRGIDTTYNMRGEIPYGRLGTRHISFVQDEIVVRGGSYDKKEGIRKLGKILLQLELTAQKNILKEKTGHEAEDSECNEKSYLPQCRSADDYTLF